MCLIWIFFLLLSPSRDWVKGDSRVCEPNVQFLLGMRKFFPLKSRFLRGWLEKYRNNVSPTELKAIEYALVEVFRETEKWISAFDKHKKSCLQKFDYNVIFSEIIVQSCLKKCSHSHAKIDLFVCFSTIESSQPGVELKSEANANSKNLKAIKIDFLFNVKSICKHNTRLRGKWLWL